jgi:hypothetical protein
MKSMHTFIHAIIENELRQSSDQQKETQQPTSSSAAVPKPQIQRPEKVERQ